MKRITIVCCSLLTLYHVTYAQLIPQKAFWVCGDTKVLLVDYNGSKGDIPNVIWSWDSKTLTDIPKEYHAKLKTVDDCKSYGNEVLISASSGAIVIVGMKDKKTHFYADVPLAHSVEMLPGGLLAAAASTHIKGNRVFLFDTRKGNTPIYSDTLYSAHGLVWNNKQKSLFALGYIVLREYKLNDAGNGLILKNEWKIPGNVGHDLQTAPDKNHLFSETGDCEFDLKLFKFIKMVGFADTPTSKALGKIICLNLFIPYPKKTGGIIMFIFLIPHEVFIFQE